MTTAYTVSKKESGKRLDQWVTTHLKVSRKEAKRWIDAGNIRIRGKKTFIASWELREGDKIDIVSSEKRRSLRYLKVYFEDRDLLVVEKPPGLLSVPEIGEKAESLLDHVRGYLKRKYRESKGVYVAPLHRLDSETSGVMVFACSTVGKQLEDLFREHRIVRRYVAVVAGPVEEEAGTIHRPLEKGHFSGGRKSRVSKQGEKAVTMFRVRERYSNAKLLDVELQTGRTHQIRVHLASIGHPVLGDKIYGATLHALENRRQPARQALHASLLGFRHPGTKKKVEFRSPLPKDMKKLIDQLRGI